MKRLVFSSDSEQATWGLGRALAEVLPPRTTLALCGPLGAGKTRLVQAIAAGLGVDPRDVLSPTFVLVHEYAGRVPICHFDAYRLRDQQEFLDLGPEEYYERPGVTLIEWADRVADCLPRARIDVGIEITGAQSRRFTLVACAAELEEVLDRLGERLGEQERGRS